jgi:hypothetical protein
MLNYGATNVVPIQKDLLLLLSKWIPYFQTHTWSWNKQKFGHGSQQRPKINVSKGQQQVIAML